VSVRLHVVLGAGGVGKTTLAAGYALSLAREEKRRVGLLGIDPSRRLKDALGIALSDADAPVPGAPRLRASILQPADSLRRWATEASSDPNRLARLFGNPFFAALADRLATATDIFAAARIAEWAEGDPSLTDLVIDTAPGLNAIEFLTRPERVASFLGGRLVGWLRWVARGDTERGPGVLRGGARRVVAGLVRIAGSRLLVDLSEFFSLIDAAFARMLQRVQVAQLWLRSDSTEILLVTSGRDDGAPTARGLARALGRAGLAPRAVVLNRALPAPVVRALGELSASEHDPAAAPVLHYALACAALQERVVEQVRGLAPTLIVLPQAAGLDAGARLDGLERLGELLRAGLLQDATTEPA
jgi:anion-transporting  ArsA/GET3 family ATPase